MCCTVLASLIFLCTSRIVQWGALRTSCAPYVSSGIRGKKEKRERAAASHNPAFALSSSPLLSLLPQEGEHHTLSANQNSAPPSPSHHLSFQGNRATPLSLSFTPSLFPNWKVPHHHHHPSHPSFHPTVPYWAGGYFSFSLSCVSIISVSLSLALFLQWDCHNINGTSLLLTLHPLTEKQRRKKWDGLKDEQRCGMYC